MQQPAKRPSVSTRPLAFALAVTLIGAALTACTSAASGPGSVSDASGANTEEMPRSLAATDEFTTEAKPASPTTSAANRAVFDLLDFDDRAEFDNAGRGLLAAPEVIEIRRDDGHVVWSQRAFEFVDADAPDSANPSLWRNTQLNHHYGLFEVVDGIYQVRGYDITNFTVIRGDAGWIVFDPVTTVETATASLQLINDVLGERPVTGVIYSHSHGDHYGGVKGVTTQEEVASGAVPIIAPAGFEQAAVAENIYAGNAMLRRADFQYGTHLTPGPQGRLAIGLGVSLPKGTSSYISPTDIISETGEVRVVDGITMEFQMTPGTEAPAEMNTWFPQLNAFWGAENCNGTLHNLYTLRGAQVRDGNAWAAFLMESAQLYPTAEVLFTSHNWPRWGAAEIQRYLTDTAAVYKFINDQTLLYLNQGYTANEIADMIRLPDALETVWYTRQYYGTLKHNSKAVYQKYMGWYDANPAHLDPLPPVESARRTVEYMGGAEAVLARATEDYAAGDYQWVAEVTMAVVFVEPANLPARYLCADALEQLGYQAESGTWRSAYLTGAQELRDGGPGATQSDRGGSDLLQAMTPTMVFDFLGIRVDSNAAQDLNMTINVNVLGDQEYLVTVHSGVVLYQAGRSDAAADVSITVPNGAVAAILAPQDAPDGLVTITGDTAKYTELLSHVVVLDPMFNIIEP